MRSGLRYLFFGWVDGWQSEQIEQLQQQTLANDIEVGNDVESLRRQLRTQASQIEELATIVNVLSRMLAEAGDLDPKVLAYRVEAELDERRHPPSTAPTSVKCVLCGAVRSSSQVSTSAYGAVCQPSCT